MKKNYFLALTLACISALYAGAVQVPYSSAIGDLINGKIMEDWTVEDANNDKTSWEYDSTNDNFTTETGWDAGVKYKYNKDNQANDWLFSPAFELEAGKEYLISYWIKESKNNMESLSVHAGPSASSDDYENGSSLTLKEYDKNIGAQWIREKILFSPQTTGSYHIAFHVTSEPNQWGILLRGFTIKENILSPAAPTSLSIKPEPDKTLKATLTWVLPTTDDDGNMLSKALTGVNIRRNGKIIATLPGDATEYIDESIPEPGRYEYEVSALIDNSEGFGIKAISNWIGILTAQPLPFIEEFKNPDFFQTFWTTIDANNDAKINSNTSYPPLANAWCFQTNMAKNAYWAAISSARNAEITDDDWLISPPLAFPAKGKYKISFKLAMYMGASAGCNLTVYVGKNNIVEAFDTEIANITEVPSVQLNPNTDGTLYEYEFEVPSAGAYYIGFHSTNPASTVERRLQFGAFHAEVIELMENEILVPPYRSESDPNWTDKEELTFIAMPGYYHASWQTDGDVSVDNFQLDTDFNTEYAVLKVEEESNVLFASTSPFTAFEILPVNHTPAEAEECSYLLLPTDEIEFSVKAPMLNIAGSSLYEIEGMKIYADDQLIAVGPAIAPGEVAKVTVDGTPVEPTRDAASVQEPVYTVVLHNLSGESSPKIAQKNVESGIENININDLSGKLYNINGVEVKSDSKPAAGLYIEIVNGNARKVIVK